MKDRHLEVLEILEAQPDINQRDLARETRMALGLVNSCLKRLVRKGLVKMREAPGRRYLYYLTPKGFAEKSRLTYEYVRYSVHFYAEARQRCREVFAGLEAEGIQRVAFIGGGDLAEIAYLTMQEFSLDFAGLYDDTPDQGAFFGHVPRPLSDLAKCDRTSTLVYTRLNPPAGDPCLKRIEFIEIFGNAIRKIEAEDVR